MLHNMAQIHLDQQRLEIAEDLLHQALAICKPLSASRVTAQVEHRIGELRLNKGDFAGAEATFESVLRTVLPRNDLVGQAYALFGLGAARMKRELHQQAEADLRAALEVATRCGDRLIVGRILLAFAELYQGTARPGPARDRLDEALEVFREIGSAVWQARALEASARLREAAGSTGASAPAVQEGPELRGEAGPGLPDG